MNDESNTQGLNRRWLQQRFEMLSTVKAEANHEFRLNGVVSENTHAEFETEILNMYDALEHKKDHDAARETWDEFEMDMIPHYCGQTRVVKNDSAGHFGIQSTSEEVVLERAPREYLKRWYWAFVRITDALGLNTSVESEKGDMFQIKRDPEDYPKPVKDDIPKPE